MESDEALSAEDVWSGLGILLGTGVTGTAAFFLTEKQSIVLFILNYRYVVMSLKEEYSTQMRVGEKHNATLAETDLLNVRQQQCCQ